MMLFAILFCLKSLVSSSPVLEGICTFFMGGCTEKKTCHIQGTVF